MANHKEFVLAYVDACNKGTGTRGVSNRLNITNSAIYQKASKLRNLGVNLPQMPRNSSAVDVEELNELIQAKLA